MESMGRPKVYLDELRDRAVRLVREWREARGDSDGGYTAVCRRFGLHRETLRRWVIDAEVEIGTVRVCRGRTETGSPSRSGRTGSCAGPTILKSAAAFFGADSTADRSSSPVQLNEASTKRGKPRARSPPKA